MAKQNYQRDKRQRDLARQKKQEEKRQKKAIKIACIEQNTGSETSDESEVKMIEPTLL